MEILSPASLFSNSNWLLEESKGARWTAAENKLFENALAVFDKETPDRWHNVAAMIPGKTVSDVIMKYKELEHDVSNIEAGLIPIPGYTTSTFKLDWVNGHGYDGFNRQSPFALGGKRSSSTRPADQERKKGVPWTEEEHKLFLMGLNKYGKGDWRNISRNFVVTRTPTQVASHAQKYFIRQLSGGKDKRRASIHDITTVNLNDARTPSPENKRPASPDHSSVVGQHLNSAAMSRTPFEWNRPSGGGANLGFHMTNGHVFMSNPYGINTYGPKMQGHNNLHRGSVHDPYFGPQSMVFQMQSTQHFPHG